MIQLWQLSDKSYNIITGELTTDLRLILPTTTSGQILAYIFLRSVTDGQTYGQTDDIMMPIADHTVQQYDPTVTLVGHRHVT